MKLNSPFRFKLRPGQSVEGRVVDKDGKPIEGAHVYAQDRRGKRQALSIHSKTDANGTFRIKDLPVNELIYSIGKEGFMMVENYLMKPSDKAHTITLTAPLRITGSVVDAETNQPIDKFSFIVGSDNDDGRAPEWPEWFEWKRKTGRNGRYEFEEQQAWQSFCLVVIHEQGVGMIIESDLEKSTEIRIQPWNEKNQRMQIIRRPSKNGEMVDFPVR